VKYPRRTRSASRSNVLLVGRRIPRTTRTAAHHHAVKDRFVRRSGTHYPLGLSLEVSIIHQEVRQLEHEECRSRVPDFMTRSPEDHSQHARK